VVVNHAPVSELELHTSNKPSAERFVHCRGLRFAAAYVSRLMNRMETVASHSSGEGFVLAVEQQSGGQSGQHPGEQVGSSQQHGSSEAFFAVCWFKGQQFEQGSFSPVRGQTKPPESA